LAKKKNTNFYYAIKILRKDDMIRKNQIDNIKQERKILIRTNNPFIVKLYYTFQSANYLYLVQEYCNGGDCGSMLKIVGSIDEDCARIYIAEIVEALEYLHSQGIVHRLILFIFKFKCYLWFSFERFKILMSFLKKCNDRDLKPDNILIDADGHIKLTDFGLSKIGFLKRNDMKRKSSQVLENPPDKQKEKEKPRDKLVVEDVKKKSNIQLDLTFMEKKGSSQGSPANNDFVGTPDYLAPEVILGITELGPVVDWVFFSFLFISFYFWIISYFFF